MKPALVILAGGMGSRYGGLKQLEAVGPEGETIVDYSVYDAIRAGFQKIVFVVRDNMVDEFRVRISDRFSQRVEVEFVCQSIEPEIPGVGVIARKKPWGTTHAALMARDVVADPFAVLNADDYYGAGAFQTMHDCLVSRVSATHFCMIGYELSRTLSRSGGVSRAICERDDTGHLLSIVERKKIIATGESIADQSANPAVELAPDNLVSMNFWGFHPSFFKTLEEKFIQFAMDNQTDPAAECYIPTVIGELLKDGSVKVEVLECSDQWHGLTYAEDRADVRSALSQMTKDKFYPSPLWGA